MKKLLFTVACIASYGLFFFGQKTPENSSDLTLENIEAAGLNATEAWCNPQNKNPCIIEKNGLVLRGEGIPTIED